MAAAATAGSGGGVDVSQTRGAAKCDERGAGIGTARETKDEEKAMVGMCELNATQIVIQCVQVLLKRKSRQCTGFGNKLTAF